MTRPDVDPRAVARLKPADPAEVPSTHHLDGKTTDMAALTRGLSAALVWQRGALTSWATVQSWAPAHRAGR